MKIFLRLLALGFVILGAIGLHIMVNSNDILSLTPYIYQFQEVPAWFQGKKILHLSDYHNHHLQYENGHISDLLDAAQADVDYIVLTGDIIDNYTTPDDLANLQIILESLKKPTYFIPGNHEEYATISITDFYQDYLIPNGITFLDDQVVRLYNEDGSEYVNLIGVHDPYRETPNENYFTRNDYHVYENLQDVYTTFGVNKDDFNLLLAHRPELLDIYAKEEFGIEAVFSGHTHGGQINLAIGVPYIVNQGLFPYYTRGEYTRDNTVMYISAGIGNSHNLPVRYNCNMEMLKITF